MTTFFTIFSLASYTISSHTVVATKRGFCTNRINACAFNIPSIGEAFSQVLQPPSFTVFPSSIEKDKLDLLRTISGTNNGKDASTKTQSDVLGIVKRLETNGLPGKELLADQEMATIYLDGVWYLQYTSPSVVDGVESNELWNPSNPTEGKSKIPVNQFAAQGTVTASGITVDTSNRVVKQSFDMKNSRVTNEIGLDFGEVTVSGTFRQSETVPNRAVVSFDTADIDVGFITVKLGWIFSVLGTIKGSYENGWLETTFVDEELRIGRGNKGTMFVLTRERNAVFP